MVQICLDCLRCALLLYDTVKQLHQVLYFVLHLTVIDCGMPPSKPYMQVTLRHGTKYQAIATYTCSQSGGQKCLEGPATRHCNADGKWSGTEPSCIGEWTFVKMERRKYLMFCLFKDEFIKVGSQGKLSYSCWLGYLEYFVTKIQNFLEQLRYVLQSIDNQSMTIDFQTRFLTRMAQ